jgi:hypothetical protein
MFITLFEFIQAISVDAEETNNRSSSLDSRVGAAGIAIFLEKKK